MLRGAFHSLGVLKGQKISKHSIPEKYRLHKKVSGPSLLHPPSWTSSLRTEKSEVIGQHKKESLEYEAVLRKNLDTINECFLSTCWAPGQGSESIRDEDKI